MVTDGYAEYVLIIEKLNMAHQKCIFHKIMNQRMPIWKTTSKVKRQLQNKENKLEKTKEKNTTTRKSIQRTKTGENSPKRQKRLNNKEKLKKNCKNKKKQLDEFEYYNNKLQKYSIMGLYKKHKQNSTDYKA